MADTASTPRQPPWLVDGPDGTGFAAASSEPLDTWSPPQAETNTTAMTSPDIRRHNAVAFRSDGPVEEPAGSERCDGIKPLRGQSADCAPPRICCLV